MKEALLTIEDLTVAFEGQRVPVLDRVCLQVPSSGWMGLVGESGSGKSLTSLAVLGLLPPGAHVLGGRAVLDGRDLLKLDSTQLREMRGRQAGMIFQNPRSALNPLMAVGRQIERALVRSGTSDSRRPRSGAVELLRKVRIPDPELRARAYPHQLSGGTCQRVLIAMMLAARPRLLIADEPTTGLDVTVQAEILELMHELQEETGMVVLLISHDLSIVSANCGQVSVMYGGTVVETAPASILFSDPRHPYTAQLISTLLRADRPVDLSARPPRVEIPELPERGCRFAPRCPHADDRTRQNDVRLQEVGEGHQVACLRQEELAGLSVKEKASHEGVPVTQ